MKLQESYKSFVTTGRELEKKQEEAGGWSFENMRGRLVELRQVEASAVLTCAFSLVLEAQQALEPIAWIIAGDSFFYPPDVQENGVDLRALVVVRVHGARNAGRAADHLIRSGAFGLVILDLGADSFFPTALQSRLVHGATQHHAAVICLTEEDPSQPRAESLGPLVSLRAAAHGAWKDGQWECQLEVGRDKRRGLGWKSKEVCRGPVGMR